MPFLFLFLLMCLMPLSGHAQYSVKSPNGKTTVRLNTNRARRGKSKMVKPKNMYLTVTNEEYRGALVYNKEIGLVVKSKGKRHDFGRMEMKKVIPLNRQYESDEEKDSLLMDLHGPFNSLTLETEKGITLEVRAYNDGVAYRFYIYGFSESYKLLDVCNVFPQSRPVAILDTYEGDYAMPWMVMENEKAEKHKSEGGYCKEGALVKVIPWEDAPVMFTAGATFDWFEYGHWAAVNQRAGAVVDCTYKYLYAGLGFTPCQQINYIYWDYDNYPFEGVMGNVHAWDLSTRLGFALPVQTGYDIWTIAPYFVGSYYYIGQHETRVGHVDFTPHNHYAFGAGFKIQYSIRDRVVFGVGYEYQRFNSDRSPRARNSCQLTIGYRL